MEKSKLTNFISKYNLSGMIQTVEWNVNGSLSTRFISDDRGIIGEVKLKTFSADPINAGIIDTQTVLKLLSAMENELNISFVTSQTTAVSMVFDDSSTTANLMLAALDVIPNVPSPQKEPPYELSITLNKEFIDKFIKARNALSDHAQFTVLYNAKKGKYQIVIGHSVTNSTKISIDVECEATAQIDDINFSAVYFKELLSANKDCTIGKMLVSSQGLAKIEFESDEYSSKYYLMSEHSN